VFLDWMNAKCSTKITLEFSLAITERFKVPQYFFCYIPVGLISFGAESVVFQVAIQKLKDQDIKNYNFARGFVWV